jgi:leucyl aminopeptidase
LVLFFKKELLPFLSRGHQTLPEVAVCKEAPQARAVIVPVRAGEIPREHEAAAAVAGFVGESGTSCLLLGGDVPIVLAGLGQNPGRPEAEAAGAAGIAAVLRMRRVALDARGLAPDMAAAFALGACVRAWHPRGDRTVEDEDAPRVSALDLLAEDPAVHAAWARASCVLAGVEFARNLVTEPANSLTPATFIDRLRPLVDAGVALEVLGPVELAKHGFGGLLAVGGGAAHPPHLAVLRWTGSGGAPVVFVGKGVTFDTGGISIKPAEGMWDMRADMAGAAPPVPAPCSPSPYGGPPHRPSPCSPSPKMRWVRPATGPAMCCACTTARAWKSSIRMRREG